MNVTHEDLWWLWKSQPLLAARASASRVEGTLEISAYFERETGRLISSRHPSARTHDTFIADQFDIRVEFDVVEIGEWPKVYDGTLRHQSIARRYKIPVADLHFYPTGEACLGFEYPWDPDLTLQYFLTEIVEPFFYRLSYVDLYGLTAARTDLWREHSHGIAGLIEHDKDVRWGLRGRKSSKDHRNLTRALMSR